MFKGREQLKGQGTGPWKCSFSVRPCHLDETDRMVMIRSTSRDIDKTTVAFDEFFLEFLLDDPRMPKALGDIRSWEDFCLVPSLTPSSKLTRSVLREIEKRMALTL